MGGTKADFFNEVVKQRKRVETLKAALGEVEDALFDLVQDDAIRHARGLTTGDQQWSDAVLEIANWAGEARENGGRKS